MTTQGYATYGAGVAARDTLGQVVGDAEIEIYDSQVGGVQITDLLDTNDNPIDLRPKSLNQANAPTPYDVGRWIFQARETYTALWGDRGYGPRWLFLPDDIGTRLTNAVNGANQAMAGVQDAVDSANSAAASANEAASSITAMQAQLDNTQQQQNQLMAAASTIDELALNFTATSNNETAIWAAPFPCKITSCSAVFKTGIAASDTTYEVLTLAKRAATDPTVSTNIVSKTSKLTGGEGITAWKAWNFDGATWDPVAQTFATNDVLTVAIPNVGTPNVGSALLTIRYQPLGAAS
jgi:hypothetical protein